MLALQFCCHVTAKGRCRRSFQNKRGTCVQELFTCIVSSEKEGGKRQRKTEATLTPKVSEFKG